LIYIDELIICLAALSAGTLCSGRACRWRAICV